VEVATLLVTSGAQVDAQDQVSGGFEFVHFFFSLDGLPSIMLVVEVIWRW
jgi:hypothetical protein